MQLGLWIAGTMLTGVVCVSGCQTDSLAATGVAPIVAVAVASSPAAGDASSIEVTRDNFNFQYSWPVTAAAFPKLLDYFRTDAMQMQGELEASFNEDERLKDPTNEFKPTYETNMTWEVAAQTDDLISLSGSWYNYMGGAHGMYGLRDFVYDKRGDEILLSRDLIGDTDAFTAAIEEEFCRLLDTEREKRRGEPVVRDDMFGDCVNLIDQTLVWKSKTPGKFDRLEVFIGPYEAGPYAEGAYVLNLPITAPMVAAIAPQYRGNFLANGGNPYAVED